MNHTIRRRLVIIHFIFILLFAFIIGKLVYIHVYEGDELRKQVEAQKLLERKIESKRGMILDRNDVKLGFTMEKYKISVNSPQITNWDYTVEKLALALSMSEAAIWDIIHNSNNKAIKIVDVYDKDVADELNAMLLKGVWIDKEDYRRYPNGPLASQVIGYVRDLGDRITGYGVEIHFDDQLTGMDGLLRTETDKWNNELVYNNRFEIPAVNGQNVKLTIDSVMQHYLESALKESYDIQNPSAAHGILMDVNTGEILAMGSYPTFDPNNQSVLLDVTNEELEGLTATEVSNLYTTRFKNHLIQDRYELGSTLKLVTAAIALEENFYTPESVFEVGNTIKVADKTIHCWYYPQSHGKETLTQAVENSCNPVFVTIGQKIGKDLFYDYFEAFGLTERTGINLPFEANSIVFKREDVNETELATMTFGHGVATTPIQVITAISAIVNGGYLLEPHIVKNITDEKDQVVFESKKTVRRQVISEITSTQMRGIMRSVVDNGSGHSIFMEGIPIGAKTGTSEKPVKGVYSKEKVISSFIAVAPIDDPEIALFIFVDEPKKDKYGSLVAAPIAKSILNNILPYMGMEKKFETITDIVHVPSIVGLTIGEARSILEEMNLNYMTTPLHILDDSKLVVDQYPKAGTPIKANEPINIHINE